MAIEPIKIFQNNADNSIAALFSGGTNVLTGILNNAVQVGRDISNKQLQQEQDLIGMRRQETALQQRRAENLQQDWEDVFRFSENRRQFDTKFSRGLFESDRAFGANRADQAWEQAYKEEALSEARRRADQTYALQAAQEKRLSEGAQLEGEKTRFLMDETKRQAELNQKREWNAADLLKRQQHTVVTEPGTGFQTSVPNTASSLGISGLSLPSSAVAASSASLTPGDVAVLGQQAKEASTTASDLLGQASKQEAAGNLNQAELLRQRAQEAKRIATELTRRHADAEAALGAKDETPKDGVSFAQERDLVKSLIEGKWRHFVPNDKLAELRPLQKAWEEAPEANKEATASAYSDKQAALKSNIYDRVVGQAQVSTSFDEFVRKLVPGRVVPEDEEATAALEQVWEFVQRSKRSGVDPLKAPETTSSGNSAEKFLGRYNL